MTVLAGLMEAFIERIADMLERVGADLGRRLQQHFRAQR